MTIPSTKPPSELLISALAGGDARIRCSFRKVLDRVLCKSIREEREALDALVGILEGLERLPDAEVRKALEPTLRHLLARVL